MSWVTLVEADLQTALSGPEISAYRAAALAVSQPDPVPVVLAQVISLVRGYVAQGGVALHATTSLIPEELKTAAIDLVAVRIPGRVGKDPSDGRRAAGEEAMRILRDAAAGRISIGQPDTPATADTSSSGKIQQVSGCGYTTGSQLDGL